MLISQVSQMTGRAANLLSTIVEHAPIFQFAQFRADASSFPHGVDKSTFSNSAARAEGSAVQKDAQVPALSLISLALYGREISIDDVRKLDARIAGSTRLLEQYSERQLRALALKLAAEVQDDIVIGTAANSKMLGISNLVKDSNAAGQTAALGFTTAEQAAMNQNVTLQLSTTANQDTFVEILYKALGDVRGANAILVNSNLAARLMTIAKRVGAAGETVNSFGVPVSTFNNVPIVTLPTTSIIQTESDGSNSDCTSAYVVRFAEELGVCLSTNSGFYFQDFQDFPTYPNGTARMQMFLQLVVERTDALKRLSRIRL